MSSSSSSSSAQWCTIESDPGVFTSLIETLGVQNAEFTELWSLDDDSLAALGPTVLGLIFLFKWTREETSTGVPLGGDDAPKDLFFARQMTTNACATQAILSVLLNAKAAAASKEGENSGGALVLGPTLESFKNFTASFPPELRGEAIGASDEIRTAHNSFARNDSFISEQKKSSAGDDDDVFHFVAYVPHTDDCVYELDGLRDGPVRVGRLSDGRADGDDGNWLAVARSAIQERIEKYAASEIKFNLMAVIKDKRIEMNDKLKILEEAGLEDELQDVKLQLLAEEEKRKQWKLENERRRHNYLPFIIQLLKEVARSGGLEDMTKKANEKAKELKRKADERKEMAAKKQCS